MEIQKRFDSEKSYPTKGLGWQIKENLGRKSYENINKRKICIKIDAGSGNL